MCDEVIRHPEPGDTGVWKLQMLTLLVVFSGACVRVYVCVCGRGVAWLFQVGAEAQRNGFRVG